MSAPPPAGVHGRVAPGYEAVAEAFACNLRERGELGAAFAAVRDGELVVDLWGGLADRRGGRPWESDTLAWIFSGTKGIVATCLLMLIERGALALDRPVAEYWPEFAAHGKQDVLVEHVLSHRAGLPGLTTPVTAAEATDHVRMAALLAGQPALTPAGEMLCYHAITFGWLCGELVRRVDGRNVGRFLRDEVAGPLALDTWIGLPAEHEPRVAQLEPDASLDIRQADRSGDPVGWSIRGNPPRFGVSPLPPNTRAWHAAELPATGGITTARSLARLYGCLARGGELDGVRLLAPETLRLAETCLARAHEPQLDHPMAFSAGFELQTEARQLGPLARAFGHTGTGGSVHGAWPDRRVGFSYAMNLLRSSPVADPRAAALLAALERATADERPVASDHGSAGGAVR